jgi:uncharacterized membrane protein
VAVLANIVVGLVALLHLYFLVLENHSLERN